MGYKILMGKEGAIKQEDSMLCTIPEASFIYISIWVFTLLVFEEIALEKLDVYKIDFFRLSEYNEFVQNCQRSALKLICEIIVLGEKYG